MASTANINFNGQHRHTLDNKLRLSIPAAFRNLLGEGETFFATPNPGKFITVLTPAGAAKQREKFDSVPRKDTAARDTIAWIRSLSVEMKFDDNGRTALLSELLKFASITKEVVIVGMGEEFNIYDKAHWEEIEQRQNPTTLQNLYEKYDF